MSARPTHAALLQYVDDEMLRAPLLFDQIVDGAIDHARKDLALMPPAQRATFGDLMQALLSQRARIGDYFLRSLREQVDTDLSRRSPGIPVKSTK